MASRGKRHNNTDKNKYTEKQRNQLSLSLSLRNDWKTRLGKKNKETKPNLFSFFLYVVLTSSDAGIRRVLVYKCKMGVGLNIFYSFSFIQ